MENENHYLFRTKYEKVQKSFYDEEENEEEDEVTQPMIRQPKYPPRPALRINLTRLVTARKGRKFACLIRVFLILTFFGLSLYLLMQTTFTEYEDEDTINIIDTGSDPYSYPVDNDIEFLNGIENEKNNRTHQAVNSKTMDFLPRIRVLADSGPVHWSASLASVFNYALGFFGWKKSKVSSVGKIDNGKEEGDFGFCPKPDLHEIITDLNIPDLYQQIFPARNKALMNKNSKALNSLKAPVVKRDANATTESTKLTVFVVLHSHNDAGWGETFEDYYRHRTKNILDHLLKHLTEDPEIKFIWSETCFFDLWWSGLTTEKRDQVKKLVANKQLEFVGGGWVMPDEATPYYLSQVTQLIEGHQWLRQHLNYTPSNGWVIDPFGISSTSSFLQQRSGFKNTVFSRIHYKLRELLVKEKKTEFYWRQPWDFNGTTDIYAYQMPYGTYDIGATCGPESTEYARSELCKIYRPSTVLRPKAKDEEEEIQRRAELLLAQYKKKASLFHTYNVLQPIGADFAWQSYQEWNEDIPSLKNIFTYINSNEELNTEIKFATLSEYFEAVHKDTRDNKLTAETEVGWKPSVFSGDFFTYADQREEYWSGYYASRIFHKGSERQLMTLIRSSQLIYTTAVAEISKTYAKEFDFMRDLLQKIVEARRTLSLFQHHDGITGTSTTYVVQDYAIKLFQALNDCHTVIQQCIYVLQNIKQRQSNELISNALETQLNSIKNDDIFYTPVMNKSQSDSLWEDKVHYIDHNNTVETIAIFNSLAKARKQMVRISVTNSNVKVVDLNNVEFPSEIFPIFKYFNKHDKNGTKLEDLDHFNHFELFFIAELRPLEVKHFQIVHDLSTGKIQSKSVRVQIFNTKAKFTQEFKDTFDIPTATDSNPDGTLIPSKNKIIRISNHYLTLDFNENGTAKSVEMEGIIYPMNITFNYYKTRRSGLYLFIPFGPDSPVDLMGIDPVIIVVEGRLRSYVEVWFPTVRHRLILLNHDGLEGYGMHVENIVDIRDQNNYELIMKISTKIKSENAFYTDSNGFQMMRRENRDSLPIQANYYPIASSAFLEDSDLRLTVLTAQPGGIASLTSGQLEIMIDRKINQDDYKGIGQGGTDNLETISALKIILEKTSLNCRNSSVKNENQNENHSQTENLPLPSPLPLLSLQANLQQLNFLHPLQAYKKIVPNNEDMHLISRTASDYTLNSNLPCDIHLLGAIPLASFSDSKVMNDTGIFLETSSQSAILFHRMGIDGRFKMASKPLQECIITPNDENEFSIENPFRFGQLKFKDIFGNLFKHKIMRTSLSLSHKDKYFNGAKTFELEPMEIYSFIANYKDNHIKINRTKIDFKTTMPEFIPTNFWRH